MERSFWSTIRGKLLSRMLVVVLLPVLMIGGVAVLALRSLSGTADSSVGEARTTLTEDVIGTRVAGVSEQIAREIAIFLNERLADAEGWSTDPGLIAAARAGADRAAVLGLTNLSVEDAEAQFDAEPRLGDPSAEQDLLNAVATNSAFKEIFITDVNGFNVDYSNRTSDFVQSDERWWTSAMDNRIDISEPEFDASADVFAVDVAIRIDDDGQPVGVLKAALDIELVQVIADRFARGTDGFDISIIDVNGRFLAETSSAHEPSHIMSASYPGTDAVLANPRIAEALASSASRLHPAGFSIHEDAVGGYAHVADQLAALRGRQDAGLRALDWAVVVEQPADIAFASLAPLERLTDQVSDTSSKLSTVLAMFAVMGGLAAAAMALIFGRRLTTPIIRLRNAAVTAAEVTLPNVVAQIDSPDEDIEVTELETVTLNTGDEVEDLAVSFNTVQQTAANLATEQARMRRRNVAATFVNLGRRNQNLLALQLEHINSMENNETDADTLQRLFQLDHLATRMRRNAESLLVLAGEETPRRFRQPVSMHQLLQAAGGEIEDFGRVELTSLDDALVEGGAASDVAHLLAELLENASSFSPPGSPIQVHGRRRENSYLLAIVDQGIGMEEHDLAAANARLLDPDEFDRAPSAYLGLFVVGHLAKRHGIRVRLADSPYGGLSAQLQLPAGVLAVQKPSTAAMPAAPISTVETHAPTGLSAAELQEIEALERALLDEMPEPELSERTNALAAPNSAMGQAQADAAPVLPPPPAPASAVPSGAPVEMAAPAPPPPPPPAPAPAATAPSATTASGAPVEMAAPAPPPPPPPAPPAPAPAAAAVTSGAPVEVAAPAAVAASSVAPSGPFVTSVEDAQPSPRAETTPSGFRRRRRGEEGAPEPVAPLDPERRAASVRRSPEEVQASLDRFRTGVAAGRARASNNDDMPAHPDSGGDTQ